MKTFFAFEIYSILLFLLFGFASFILVSLCGRCAIETDSSLFIYGCTLEIIYRTLFSYPKAEQNPKIVLSLFFLLFPYYTEKGNLYKALCHVGGC